MTTSVAAASAPAVRAPVAVGLVATGVGLLWSWVPSVWADEAATFSAATRPWADLDRLTTHIDAVHGLYYAVVHVWLSMVGTTPFSLRLLSALAVGAGAAGVVVLGRALAGPAAGVYAGVVFAVLPRVTWMATEGRSAALATAAAVWITVLLVGAVRRGGAVRWAAYAVAAGLGTALWMFLGLLVLAHGVALLLGRAGRRRCMAFGVAAVVALLISAPMLVRARTQSGQVSWIPEIGPRTIRLVAVDQWFGTDGLVSLPLALVCWALVVGVLVRSRSAGSPRGDLSLVAVALPWLLLPTVGVVAYSLVGDPLYTPKYLAFCTPAMALLVGEGIAHGAASTRWANARIIRPGVAMVAAVALLALPSYVSERRPAAKDASDWAQTARWVERTARPGDAVVFTDLYNDSGAVRFPGRAVAVAYPSAFAALSDPTRLATARSDGTLWDGTAEPAQVRDALVAAHRVVLVSDHAVSADGEVRRQLEAMGFTLEQEWRGSQTDVLTMVVVPR